MKFRCERDVLVEALATTGRAVSVKAAGSPTLAGVHLRLEGDTLRLAGVDRDLTIQTSVTVAAVSDGSVVVPARLVSDIVRALEPGAVEFEAFGEDETVRISLGKASFVVRALPAEEFPRLTPSAGAPVVLDAEVLASALRQVVRAASTDNDRPVLTGVLLAATDSGVRLVATDSYRLAMRDVADTSVLAAGQKVLLPSRALSELQRLVGSGGAVELRLGEFEAHFDVGPTRLTTRLLEGEYPNYAGLIPKGYPNRLVVGREGLLDAVRRVRLMARDATTPVRLSLRPDGVELTVITPDLGQATEDVDAKYEGTEFTIAFNPTYLAEGIEAIEGDEVVLEAQDAGKPATLRAVEGPEYLYLLMPVKVS